MMEHHEEQPTRRSGAAADPGEEAFRRAQDEIASRLRDRGVRLTGRETGDELADLLDAVERFEAVVENAGGDLMLDEPVGAKDPVQPDDEAFVMPRRQDDEKVDAYIERLMVAAQRARDTRGG